MGRAGSDGVIRKFAISTNVFHSLLMRRVTAGASTVPLTAIITLAVATGCSGEGVVVACSGRFREKTVGLGDIEALDFAKIITPIGETGFDAVQHCGVKG